MREGPMDRSTTVWHGTTILCLRKGGQVVVAGDGQVSMGQTVVKSNAKKLRRLGGGSVIAGTPDVRQNQPGRLVAFKLNGKATLPADPPPAPLPPPPAGTWPASLVLEGSERYLALCAHCHGLNTSSPNIIPDLKRSKALGNPALWKAIVEGGAMKATGTSPHLASLVRTTAASVTRESVISTRSISAG